VVPLNNSDFNVLYLLPFQRFFGWLGIIAFEICMSFFTTYTPPTCVSRISLCHAPGFDDFWIDNYLFFRAFALVYCDCDYLFFIFLVEGLDELAESLISVLAIAMASGLFVSSGAPSACIFGGFPLGSFWSWALIL
jgi:hypothetical protein